MATRTNSGLGFILKILVAAALAFLVLNVFAPGCGAKFGCGPSSWLPSAQAADEHCPSSVKVAASDNQWAAARYETIKDRKRTTGLSYDEDGTEHVFTSGIDGDAEKAAAILQSQGAPAAKDGTHPVATHVEVKVAARMRDGNAKEAVLITNNTGGTCSYQPGQGFGCRQALPMVLPGGAELHVWDPGTRKFETFVGK
ncbi:DddA-like double-stranded DNA deaminase toxin [Actinokineospora iranica]|uniref:SCP1.201-like deaminase n=1 Tax=Actinokineospora iranica TaxID=1271860 RepID=A0A1G6X2Y2_9PSEU|nr:DddA-like double-stranded DNA deaminase toxin [Actinokineospora iranica]SDD72468.1 SCP1.201-like deaminase [Actinokineospora iranica]